MTLERLEPEEPWETDIGSMLGSLPTVDPPEGFIAAALDHRPLHAGRTLTALVLVAAGALGASLFAGSTGASLVIPQVDQMTERHLAAQASLSSGLRSDRSDGGIVENSADPGDELTVVVPEGFEWAATYEADDLPQGVYARGGQTVSIFVENGTIDWEGLPVSGQTTMVDDTQAWIDEEHDVTIVQAGDEMIAVVGLPADEVGALVSEWPSGGPSMVDRVDDLVSAVVTQLGFPAE